MKKLGVFLMLLLALATPAAAYDVAQNGGFEAGSLTGWQIFNQGSSGGQGSWYAHSSGNGTYSNLPTSPPPAGSWQAVADNSGRAAAILYQDFFIPSTTRAILSLTLWHGNASPGGYVNGSSLSPSVTNQRVRIDIINTSTNLLTTSSGVITLVYATTASTPSIVQPFTITQDVTSLAGQTVRLRIALVGTAGGIIAGVDKVKLEVSPFVMLPQQLAGHTSGAAHWGDFDGDGALEVSLNGLQNSTGYWNVWRFNSGWFPYSQPLAGLSNGATAMGDFDGDGDLDLAGAGNSPFRIRDFLIYRYDGPNNFTNIDQSGGFFTDPGTYAGSLDWGDADVDGDLDVLISGMYFTFPFENPTTYVRVNGGGGSFSSSFPGFGGVTRGGAIWASISGSGFPGVAVGGNNLTDFYLSNSGTGYTSLGFPMAGITNGAIASGDLDNDGADDLVVTGLNGSTRIAKVYNLAASGEFPAGLTGVSESSVSLGDFDIDGWLDIALCGSTGSGFITRLYHNNGNGTFTDIGAGLPGVANGNLEFGDFDGDGDLDLLLQGDTGAGAICQIYLNYPPAVNVAPSPPTDLFSWWGTDTQTVLTIGAFGSDDHTPAWNLTYNFRGGSSPGAGDIIPPMSDLATGRRLVPRAGESDLAYAKPLNLGSLGHGSLYWSVQTVDQCYLGSPWATEKVLTIGPRIAQVRDVPQDQGGWVRLTIEPSILDDPTRVTYPAMGYNVWRRIPGSVADAVAREALALDPAVATARLAERVSASANQPHAEQGAPAITDLSLVEWNGRLFSRSAGVTLANPFPAGTWEIVGSFYAMPGQGDYTFLAPTVADSGMSGSNDAAFIVTVHTGTPSVWFAGLAATGHSRDNLAPPTPQWVTAAYHTGGGNHLAWEPSPANDLHEYRIHRGTEPLFFPGPGTLAATVTTPQWTDPAHDTPGWYYFVCAVDHAGNQSGYAGPDQVTAVEPGATSFVFGLSSARPNPFAMTTRIHFTLPRDTDTRLDVYDTSGRLVRTIADSRMQAGEHDVDWDGTDRSGTRVKAGVYFYRLKAGADQASRRVVFGP